MQMYMPSLTLCVDSENMMESEFCSVFRSVSYLPTMPKYLVGILPSYRVLLVVFASRNSPSERACTIMMMSLVLLGSNCI